MLVRICFQLGLILLAATAFGSTPKLIAECDSCHGVDGVSLWDDVPTIAGISAFAHAEALFVYRDRARPCHKSAYRMGDTSRPAADMCEIVSKLNDDQIEELAAHYASQKFVRAKQETDPAKVDSGRALHKEHCERCHTEAGGNPQDDAGILAGQWMAYMRQSFADYSSGDRETSAKMKVKLDKLSQADIEALLHYYASQN